MINYTIDFIKKTHRTFFAMVKANKIALMFDVQQNNNSQTTWFSMAPYLEYMLREIYTCKFVHELLFAPRAEQMDNFEPGKINSANSRKNISNHRNPERLLIIS